MIQSIDRAAAILGLLQGARRLGIGEMASAMAIPPSTVHGIVKSLQSHGLVAQENNGSRYVLGPALLKLSSVYLDTLDVRSRSMRWMHELSSRTGSASRLGVELFGEVVIIHHEQRPDGTEQMPETGATIPSHASALGKVLLAFDPAHAADVFSGALRALTPETQLSPNAFTMQFASIRGGGFGTENEEAVVGECSLAVPISAAGGTVVAALAVVIPAAEWPARIEIETELRAAGRIISRELGASVWPPSDADIL